MSGSEADEANLASIFGGNSAQASRIPEDLRPILLNRWSSLRQQLDASRPSVAASDESGGDKSTSDPSKFLFFWTNLGFYGYDVDIVMLISKIHLFLLFSCQDPGFRNRSKGFEETTNHQK